MKYLYEFYLLNKLIEITGNLGFFKLFLNVGIVISNSTLSDLTSLTSVFPIYKSTKPPTAARVKETYNKRHNYYQDQHSPLLQHTPQGYLQRPLLPLPWP